MHRSRRVFALAAALLGLLLVWAAPGLVSSNDGSHLALARALILRGEPSLGDEVALTLWVDRARRGGTDYSDRPPGTALLAAPAVWVGALLDPSLLRTSLETHEVMVKPAATRYAETYAIHCAAVGLLGVFGVILLLRRRGLGPPAQVFAALTLGLGCLWGPYSTVLFSHVTAGALVVWTVLGLEVGVGERGDDGEAPALRPWPLLGAGLAAGWATSTDYLVGLLVLGIGLTTVPPRRWLRVLPWVLMGAAPIVAITLLYHDAAFGSPFSIGYDHHANFEFARQRLTTFAGNPLAGLWSQWGLGDRAGVLALAPVMLLGMAGLVMHGERRWLLGALPWISLLALHQTPTGGAGVDHRYLIPLMPLLAVGLGRLWPSETESRGRARAKIAGLVALALASAALSWTHTISGWG